MGRPQQPELARSGRTDLDPDRIGTELESRRAPRTKGRTGPVPPDNQPGHHPGQEADKPDLDSFAARLSGDEAGEGDSEAQAAQAPSRPAASREPALVGLALTGLRVTARALGALEERLSARWRRPD